MLLFSLLLDGLFAAMCVIVCRSKGYSAVLGAVTGFLGGLIPLIIFLLLPAFIPRPIILNAEQIIALTFHLSYPFPPPPWRPEKQRRSPKASPSSSEMPIRSPKSFQRSRSQKTTAGPRHIQPYIANLR